MSSSAQSRGSVGVYLWFRIDVSVAVVVLKDGQEVQSLGFRVWDSYFVGDVFLLYG